MALQRASRQWKKEERKHVRACICVYVSACTGQVCIDRGDCFLSPYFYTKPYHAHIKNRHIHVQHTNTHSSPLSLFDIWILRSLQLWLPKCTILHNPILCVFVFVLCVCECVCMRVNEHIHACVCTLSCCWIGIVFLCTSDRAIWQRAQGGEANADLMSQQPGRIEKCIGAVMWGDGPMSPWGIRILSCSRWGTQARPHPSTSSLLPPYTFPSLS